MTTRERTLSIGLGAFIGVGLLGFLAWQFVIGPIFEKDKQIKMREAEVAQLQLDLMDILAQRKKFEANRQQSLPSDVGVSRSQYTNLLEKLMRNSDFAPGSYKITVGEAENKSAPTIAPKKPAYTRLKYDVTVKGELYHLVDFMRSFYSQPLLHQIKTINIIRPSDQRAQGRKELDITMNIEALVLDNAPARPTLLPVVREVALLSGVAAFTGHNIRSVAEGRGSSIPPADVLASVPREYLAIPGKDVFFGPPPKVPSAPDEPELPPEDDHSPFVTLTSIVGNDDGKIIAVFRDKLDNHNYTITQGTKGELRVRGEYELSAGRWKTLPEYIVNPGPRLFFGSEEGQNLRMWRVRRVMLDSVIVEKIDAPKAGTKPKLQPLEAIAGGLGAFVNVPDGKIYKIGMGQTLMPATSGETKQASSPVKYAKPSEAWRDIYAPLAVPAAAVNAEDRGR